MYDETITIVNKLKKADGISVIDTWKKTVVNRAEIQTKVNKSVNGINLSIAESIIVLIPFDLGYLPYGQWKLDVSQGFTMSVGDIIFLEEIDTEISSANITSLKTTHKNCEVRSIQTAEKNGITWVQLKIEGV